MVMIRLARVGARKQPYYRIVVIEKDRARNGRSIEVVGTYNPRTEPATVDLKHERIAYWRGVGAQLSPIVEKLVTKNPAPVAERWPTRPQPDSPGCSHEAILCECADLCRRIQLLTAAGAVRDTIRAQIQVANF